MPNITAFSSPQNPGLHGCSLISWASRIANKWAHRHNLWHYKLHSSTIKVQSFLLTIPLASSTISWTLSQQPPLRFDPRLPDPCIKIRIGRVQNNSQHWCPSQISFVILWSPCINYKGNHFLNKRMVFGQKKKILTCQCMYSERTWRVRMISLFLLPWLLVDIGRRGITYLFNALLLHLKLKVILESHGLQEIWVVLENIIELKMKFCPLDHSVGQLGLGERGLLFDTSAVCYCIIWLIFCSVIINIFINIWKKFNGC